MDYLARREHARSQLEKKLQLKQYSDDEIAGALDRLSEQGLQSDQRFCDAFVHRRISQGYGPRRIEQELAQIGIDHGMIADALQPWRGSWQQQCVDVWLRKFGVSAMDGKQYQKQYRFMLNRGFYPEQIREVLNHANHDLESD